MSWPRAFLSAGWGDFRVSPFPGGWKAATTGSLESLPYADRGLWHG